MLDPHAPCPENPKKLDAFKQKILGLKWENGQEIASLKELFEAVDSLAHAEVLYYFSLRRRRSNWSGVLRFFGWVLGTTGVVLPLLATAIPQSSAALIPWGYVALAVAASLFAADGLFGASAGHIRFVTTQLSIERLMTINRLEWSNFASQANLTPITPDFLNKGFDLVRKYAADLYLSTLSETNAWSEFLQLETKKYADSIAAGQKAK